MNEAMKDQHFRVFRKDIEQFLKNCKKVYLSTTQKELGITVGVTPTEGGFDWNYQTGDNSFTGGAYGHPHWVILYLMRRSNCRELSKEAVSQLRELLV
jgi:hypothetical protein